MSLSLSFCLFLTPTPCQAETIDEVLALVEKNNITLRSLAHEQEAQVQDIKAGNALSGPSVEYSPFYKKGYHGTAESELIVSQEVEFPTKYIDRNRQARLQQTLNGAAYQRRRRDILLQAQLLCIDIICLNQRLQMLEQRLQSNQAIRGIYEKRMEAGDANILELNKVKLDLMEVQTQIAESESERVTLHSQLQQLSGGVSITVDATEFPQVQMDMDYPTFLELALQSDADIQEAKAEVGAQQHEVAVSRKEWLPNLSVGYRRNTELRDNINGFLVGVSFPLLNTGSKVKAARQRQLSSELSLQQTQMEVESSYQARYQELQNLRRVMDHSDVTMMQETLQLLSKALQHGEITALQYYTEAGSIYEKLQAHINVHCQSVKLCAVLHRNQL